MLRIACLAMILGLTLLTRSAAAQLAPASASSAPATRETQTIGDIAPDRPGLGDGSGIVGRGVWQIETGWSFESARQDGAVLNGFAEAFRASSFERDGGAVWIVDAGATHRLGRQAQFDVSMGRGVTAAAPDWFISAGVSLRGFLARSR